MWTDVCGVAGFVTFLYAAHRWIERRREDEFLDWRKSVRRALSEPGTHCDFQPTDAELIDTIMAETRELSKHNYFCFEDAETDNANFRDVTDQAVFALKVSNLYRFRLCAICQGKG